jgi:hypothetical protein
LLLSTIEEKTQKIIIFSLFFEDSILNWNVLARERLTQVEEGKLSLKFKQIIFYMIFLILISLNTISGSGADAAPVEDPVVILFDEAHGQFFNRSVYSKALTDLENLEEKDMEIVYNTDDFNRTTLQGVDILICTNPSDWYTADERHYLGEFLKEGKSLFLLANPLNEENETLLGRGDILNDLIEIYEIELLDRYWTNSNDVGDLKNPDVVLNEFSNAGISEYLTIDINSSSHEILSNIHNITSIVTYSCSIGSSRMSVITASPESHAKTVKDEIYTNPSGIILFGTPGELEVGAKILMGGSSIMFSDLNDPILGTSWYESENNSELWLNCIEWLAETNPDTIPPDIFLDQVLFVTVTITVVSGILLLAGIIFFTIGSGREYTSVKTVDTVPTKVEKKKKRKKTDELREDIKPETTPQLSKRDRRLKQIKQVQKQPKKRKR